MEDLNRRYQDIQAELMKSTSLTEEQVTDIALAVAKVNVSTNKKVEILEQILILNKKTNIMKVTVTKYTKSEIASIQYGDDPTTWTYNFNDITISNSFADALLRLIKLDADITVITKEFTK